MVHLPIGLKLHQIKSDFPFDDSHIIDYSSSFGWIYLLNVNEKNVIVVTKWEAIAFCRRMSNDIEFASLQSEKEIRKSFSNRIAFVKFF